MDNTNIVALILFVLPGILAEKISHKIDFPSHEKGTDFREIVNGMLLSFPIILIAGTITYCLNDFKYLNDFTRSFNDLLFLLTFSGLVFVISIVLGIFKGLNLDTLNKINNKVRGKINKMAIDNKCCWRQVFLENNINRYVKIIKDDIVLIEGFAKHYSLPNEEMSIVLEYPEDYKKHPEIIECFELDMTYVNIEKGVIIEVYDTNTKGIKEYAATLE